MKSAPVEGIGRRKALGFLAAASSPALFQGCANSPVTGKSILVGLSEQQEVSIDRAQSPRQFSADLGPVPDGAVNGYVAEVGQRVQAVSHRPTMPYSYRVVNANHVNAYTFPGGAMAVTRGILVDLQDEAELAALLGHEIGHVNARHTAQRQGQALVAQVLVASVVAAASARDSRWAPLLEVGGTLGASLLLSSYSRENEREADALGQRYMVQAGYPADGMTRLHALLVGGEEREPGLLQTMFSSHPMSRERRDTADFEARTTHMNSLKAPRQRERFMDRTAPMRAIKPTIQACQQGELLLSQKKAEPARERFGEALRLTPSDYPALLRMSECLTALRREREALAYAQQARRVLPQEGQAMRQVAALQMVNKRHDLALQELEAFDRVLPGDPSVSFLRGVNLEATGQKEAALQAFQAFVKSNPGAGQAATHATARIAALSRR